MSTSQSGDKPASTWRRLVRSRWLQALVAVLVLAVAVRVALPYAARRIAVQKVDGLLIGHVEIADVDFELLKGVVTLHGLRLYAHDAPPPSPGAEPAARAPSVGQPIEAAAAEPDAKPAAPEPPKEPAAASPSPDKVPVAAEAPHGAKQDTLPEKSAPAAAQPISSNGEEPVLSAERVTVNLGWLALFKKLVEVQQFAIETFDVRLDRARDGALVLPQPVPSPEAPPPAEEKKEGPGWGVLIDHITLRNGQLAFRDYVVSETPQAIKASIPNLDADNLALLITDTGMRPGTMVLDAALLDDGKLRLESTVHNVEGGAALESHLTLTNLPISDSRSYIPKVGWAKLDGRLDIDLIHRFDPNGTNSIRGDTVLREARIDVDGIDEPVLTCTKLAIGIDTLDLVKQHANIGTVAVDGLHLVAQPSGPEPFPLLRGLLAKSRETATDEAGAEPARSPSQEARPAAGEAPPTAAKDAASAPKAAGETAPAAPADEAPPVVASEGTPTVPKDAAPTAAPEESVATAPKETAPPATAGDARSGAPENAAPAAAAEKPNAPTAPPPWTWSVERLVVNDGGIKTRGGDAPLEVKVRAEAAPLSSDLKKRTKIDVTLSPAQGSLALTGDLAIDPLMFDGKLHIDALALPPLTQPVATPITRLLHRATLATDLEITLGEGTNAPKEGARVAGKVSVTDLEIAGDDPKLFALRWNDFSIDAKEILVPGILAKPAVTPGPINVVLATVSLTRPKIVVLRTPQGINLPPELTGSTPAPAGEAEATKTAPQPAAAKGSDKGTATSKEASTETASKDAASGEAAGAAPEVSLRADRVTVAQLRVTITDKTVNPVYHSSIDPLDLKASDLRWPGPYAKDVDLRAKGLDGAILKITGQVAPGASRLTGTLDGLPLAPLDPYAVAAGYGLAGGTFALRSKVKVGSSSYETDNKLTVNKLALTGNKGDSLFAAQFGMPLSLALSLMTDLEGNINLTLPIAGNRSGTSVAVGAVIRDALAHAILNAATSPLKLIGAVANIGEKPASLVPPPLAFEPGRAELADAEKAKLAQLAKLLEKSPGVKLEVRGETSDADSRWISEQALREKLEDESGVLGSLRHVTERGERAAALEVLRARAEGKSADMPAEYQPWLDAQVARFPVTDAKLLELATERANWVRSQIAKDEALQARVSVVPADSEDLSSRSVVTVTFATAAAADENAAANTESQSEQRKPAR